MRLDPKVVFYLRHREQIDEWLGLQEQAVAEADRFFKSLAPAFTGMAATLDGKPAAFVSLDERKPKLFLHLPHWRVRGAEYPRVAIGLEWQSSKARFDQTWAGVWVGEASDTEGGIEHALDVALRSAPNLLDGFQRDKGWPAWRYEAPPDAEYWNDLPAFGRLLVGSLANHWTRFSTIVDAAVAGTA